MVTVQRYNVILTIEDDALAKYMAMGYNQIDPITGEIINEAIPTDVQVLQVAYKQHKEKIAELEDEIAKLKKKLKKQEKAEAEPVKE